MGLAVGALFLSAPVQAQQQPAQKAPAAPAAAPKKTISSDWIKLCEEKKGETKRTVCLTHHERFNDLTGEPMVSVAIRSDTSKKEEAMMVMVPLERMIGPGLIVKVDKEEAIRIPYSYCTRLGCVAEMLAKPEIIASFKKGSEIIIGTISTSRKKIGFKAPLTGFTRAYDGPPVDRAIYTKAREAMALKIRKRQLVLLKKAREDAAKKKNAGGAAAQPAPK